MNEMEEEMLLEAEEVSLGDAQHALNNELILGKIFKLLVNTGTFQDLKNARLVTNAPNWQMESFKVWRKEVVLVVGKAVQVDALSKVPQPTVTSISVDDFIRAIKNPEDPYQLQGVPYYERVKLQSLNMTITMPLEGDAAIFWEMLGASVKHLTLANVTLDDGTDSGIGSSDLIRFLSTKLPTLVSLMLYDVDVLGIKNVDAATANLVIPKLTKLRLASWDVMGLHLSNFPNLQEIQLSSRRIQQGQEQQFFRNITNNDSVRFMDISDYYPAVWGPLRIHELSTITSNFTAIERLKVEAFCGISEGAGPEESFLRQAFPRLTELRLCGNVDGDLSFLRFAPGLQILHWDLYGYENQTEMKNELQFPDERLSLATSNQIVGGAIQQMTGVVRPHLEYLMLNCELSPEDIRTLAEWMPNLKTVKTILDSAAFEEICVRWNRKLEQLDCLFGSRINDEDIAPPKDSSRPASKRATLLDLKALKQFTYVPECRTSSISDECVEGFLQLPQLNSLSIFVSDQFTQESEARLRDRVRDVNIHRHPVADSPERLECCHYMDYRTFLSEFELVPEEEE